MKWLDEYKTALKCKDKDAVFQYLLEHLVESLTTWDYFVNWEKAIKNARAGKFDKFNTLVGSSTIDVDLKNLLKNNPELYGLIPTLIASRDRDYKVVKDPQNEILSYEEYSFVTQAQLSDAELNAGCYFLSKCGFLSLLENRQITSVGDYVLGVEAGLDSNARKNRSGHGMEAIVRGMLARICEKAGYSLLDEANAAKILDKWNIQVKVDKSSRRFDFVVKTPKALVMVETNYYGGGGSKLKSTAGEYKTLNDFLKGNGHKLIWVTDGRGWLSTRRPLEEAFSHNDFTLNLNMAKQGLLEAALRA